MGRRSASTGRIATQTLAARAKLRKLMRTMPRAGHRPLATRLVQPKTTATMEMRGPAMTGDGPLLGPRGGHRGDPRGGHRGDPWGGRRGGPQTATATATAAAADHLLLIAVRHPDTTIVAATIIAATTDETTVATTTAA